jgi:hypothetical protein
MSHSLEHASDAFPGREEGDAPIPRGRLSEGTPISMGSHPNAFRFRV